MKINSLLDILYRKCRTVKRGRKVLKAIREKIRSLTEKRPLGLLQTSYQQQQMPEDGVVIYSKY